MRTFMQSCRETMVFFGGRNFKMVKITKKNSLDCTSLIGKKYISYFVPRE
jgi:hypothetical protein